MTVCPANCFNGFAIMNAKIVIFVVLKQNDMKRIATASIIMAALIFSFSSCGPRGGRNAADAQADSTATADTMENKIIEEPEFDIVTNKGTMRIKLYSKTPKHRENFIRLVKEK